MQPYTSSRLSLMPKANILGCVFYPWSSITLTV
jgi:hypothetical protein